MNHIKQTKRKKKYKMSITQASKPSAPDNFKDAVKTTEIATPKQEWPKIEKDRLIGKKFLIWSSSWADSDTGSKYVICRIILEHPIDDQVKYRFSDGSTGVCAQMELIVDEIGSNTPILVERGLRSSTYEIADDKGQTMKATTYYLDY